MTDTKDAAQSERERFEAFVLSGSQFDSEETAVEHQAVLDLANEMDADINIHWHDTGPDQIAAWILEHYEIKRRI